MFLLGLGPADQTPNPATDRFVRTHLLVCFCRFQSNGLSERPLVSLVPGKNVVQCSGLNLVNQAFASLAIYGGVIDD